MARRNTRIDEAPDLSKLPEDAFITRRQLARVSGFAVQTLKNWAPVNRGPQVTRVENRPRYRVGDVRRWLNATARSSGT